MPITWAGQREILKSRFIPSPRSRSPAGLGRGGGGGEGLREESLENGSELGSLPDNPGANQEMGRGKRRWVWHGGGCGCMCVNHPPSPTEWSVHGGQNPGAACPLALLLTHGNSSQVAFPLSCALQLPRARVAPTQQRNKDIQVMGLPAAASKFNKRNSIAGGCKDGRHCGLCSGLRRPAFFSYPGWGHQGHGQAE